MLREALVSEVIVTLSLCLPVCLNTRAGTYDVVYSGVHTNPLRIYTTYLPNSNAAGVLYGFFYDGGSGIDFSRSAYLALSRNDSLSYEFLSPLPAGIYHVHTYVIEQNGLLSSGITFPATTEVFSVEGDPQCNYGAWHVRYVINGLLACCNRMPIIDCLNNHVHPVHTPLYYCA